MRSAKTPLSEALPYNGEVSTHLEVEISSLLNSYGDPVLVADELIRRWDRNLLSEPEQNDCAFFLVASGLYIRLFEQIVRLTEDDRALPWTALAEALGRGRVPLSAAECKALLEGATAQDALESLVQSKSIGPAIDPSLLANFEKERLAAEIRRTAAITQRRLALKERLEFLRTNRMSEEEAKTLREIDQLFPNDPDFLFEKEAFELRWANEVIANSTTSSDATKDLRWKSEYLNSEQNLGKELIVERAIDLARENPRRAYDLALSLHFMDFHTEAIDVLEYSTDQVKVDWLRLELFIHGRQFVNALDHASYLEVKYATLPDTAFAVVYGRARSLMGLEQKTMAIELLRSLVRIRPHYRSAHSLLMEWTAEGDT